MIESDSVVWLEKVCKAYGDGQPFYALNGVDLEVRRGERVAIMGPSGSGKSTMLNLICGLDVPTSGRVCVEGTDLSQLSDDQRTRLRREKVGMIFQSFNLLPTLSAMENVSLPLRLRGVSRREAEKRAHALLERVGLHRQATHRPDEMSGGECQRVAIARALIFAPPLLLADEPTGNLDSASGAGVLQLLEELHRELNTTVLLVTHDAHTARSCERMLILRDGRVAEDSTLSPASNSLLTEAL
jgi:putative ABC transport system ATP-binding protein